MCQAYEGERDYMMSRDAATRRRGYDAQKAGVLRENCPEQDHPNPDYSDMQQWRFGWDTAFAGRECW